MGSAMTRAKKELHLYAVEERFGKKMEPSRDQEETKEDITKTKDFKDWFGDSKVVDKEGKPLVVYHGTKKKFDIFDKKLLGSTT